MYSLKSWPVRVRNRAINLAQRLIRTFRIKSGPIADIGDDPLGDFLDRQHQIDKPRRHRVGRHVGEARPCHVRALGDRQPPVLLDRLEAERPVAAAAGEHDTDRVLSLVLGERGEEHVYRGAFMVRNPGVPKTEPPLLDSQDRAGWQNVDMLRFDRLVVSCVDHRHLGSAAEDLGQQAVAVRRQVGNDDKGHAVLGRHGPEKSFQRLYPARRGTDAHDRKMKASRL